MDEAAPPKTRRALITDDDQVIRRLVEKLLVAEKFEVDTAHDGLEAIRKLRGAAYDVMMLDLMMPGLSGFAVVEFIQNERPEDIDRVIVMTSRKVGETNRICNHDFTGRLLKKPFTEREFRATLQRVLRDAARKTK